MQIFVGAKRALLVGRDTAPAFLGSWGTLGFTTEGSSIAYASLRAPAEQGDVIDEVRAGSAYNFPGTQSFGANTPIITAGVGLEAWQSLTNLIASANLTTLAKGASTTVTLMGSEVGPDGNTGSVYRVQMPASSGTFLTLFASGGAGALRTMGAGVKEHGSGSQFELVSSLPPLSSGILSAHADWMPFSAAFNSSGNYVMSNGDDSYATDILVWLPFVGAYGFVPPPVVPATTRAASSLSLDATSWAANVSAYVLQDGFRTDVIAAIDYLGASATRRLWTFGVDEDNCAKLDFTTSNTFVYTLRKSGVDIFTLTSGTVSATGDYTVSITSLPGAYAMTVSGGISGDTGASSETLPTLTTAAIARAIGGTATLNGAIRQLVVGEAA